MPYYACLYCQAQIDREKDEYVNLFVSPGDLQYAHTGCNELANKSRFDTTLTAAKKTTQQPHSGSGYLFPAPQRPIS